MKLLTIIVPSYNSQDYLHRCIESLLIQDERLEILIVNDGSTDQTATISEEYASSFPEYVRVIHQENKGHGGAINTGLSEAAGLYLKVVDSDDWVEKSSLYSILNAIGSLVAEKQAVDVIINNYVYERERKKSGKIVDFNHIFPSQQIVEWKDLSEFPTGKYLMMHALIYKTELLRSMKLELPEHTFYVDNLFVYWPLIHARTMYYLDVDLYRYFIGREDQSVNEDIMMRRIDQQLLVNRLMIDSTNWGYRTKPASEEYLIEHLAAVMAISSSLLNKIGTEESEEKKRQLWQYLSETNHYVYERASRKVLAKIVKFTSKPGMWISNKLHNVVRNLAGY